MKHIALALGLFLAIGFTTAPLDAAPKAHVANVSKVKRSKVRGRRGAKHRARHARSN